MTRELVAGACPDPQMLSAYLDGKLDPTERGRIEDHISRCEDCYFVVRETALVWAEEGAEETPPAGTKRETPGRGEVVQATFGQDAATPAAPAAVEAPVADPRRAKASSFARYFIPVAATVLLFVGGGYFAREQGLFLPSYDRAMLPLVKAVGERRFFEPRLTGGFKYGPLVGPKRSGTSTGVNPDLPTGGAIGPASGDWAVLAAAASLKESAASGPTMDRQRALAASYLLVGDVGLAVSLLEELQVSYPERADICSDLAAALLQRHQLEDRASDVPKALDLALRAVALDPSLNEAYWNLALAQEQAGLLDDARNTVELALARTAPDGPDRHWLTEKKAQLSRGGLAPSSMQRDPPGALHERFELALSDAEGGKDAPLAAAAESYALVSGDVSLRHALAVLRAEPVLGAAYLAYGNARQAYARGEVAESMVAFRRVSPQLSGPMRHWAAFYSGIGDYYAGESTAAEARFKSVLSEATAKGYWRLLARSEWMLGLLALNRGSYAVAQDHYQRALDLFTRMHDQAGEAAVRSLLAECASWSGRRDLAWRLRIQAVRELSSAADWRRELASLIAAALQASDDGLGRATFAYYDQALELARAHRDSAGLADVLLFGLDFSSRFGASLADAKRTEQQWREFNTLIASVDPALVDRMRAEATTTIPVSMALADPPAFLTRAEQAERFYTTSRSPMTAKVANLLLKKAEVTGQLGEVKTASDLYWRVTGLVASLSADMSGDERAHLIETVERAVVLGVQNRGNTDPLQVASLVDTYRCHLFRSSDRCAPSRFMDSVRRMSPGTCVLQLIPTESEVVVILIGEGVARITTAPIPAPAIARHVTLLQTQLESAAYDKARGTARNLGELLFANLNLAPSCGRLGVEAIGLLSRLPVGLLWARGDAEPMAFSRQVAVLGAVQARAPRQAASLSKAVVISQARVKGYPALPGAHREAEVAADRVRGHLVQEPMTKAEFLRLLTTASDLHFAGHAAPNSSDPYRSFLVVGGLDAADFVQGTDIASLDLSRLRNVVLSSCLAGTAVGSPGPTSYGLATAFLVAGARRVTAPVVAIADQASTDDPTAAPPDGRSFLYQTIIVGPNDFQEEGETRVHAS